MIKHLNQLFFGVWAYKTVGTETPAVMENYKVEYTSTTTETTDETTGETTTTTTNSWEYKNVNGQSLKYWDKQATSYGFYAYAPYTASTSVVDITDDYKITIAEGEYAATENLQEDAWGTTLNTKKFSTDTDWMIADAVPAYQNYGSEDTELFRHTMSKLIVILKSKDVANDVEVEVISVSVNEVHGKGKYDGTKWIATDDAKSIGGEVGEFASTAGYYSMEYLLIPSSDSPTFSITYTVNGDTYTVSEAEIEQITEFAGNTCYTLTATIGLSPIEFTATAEDFETKTTGSKDID